MHREMRIEGFLTILPVVSCQDRTWCCLAMKLKSGTDSSCEKPSQQVSVPWRNLGVDDIISYLTLEI